MDWIVSRDESSLDHFLDLLQNPFKSAFKVNAIWVSLGTSLGITLAIAFLFSLFRPRNSIVYAPKLKHADRKHAPPPLGRGLFAWIIPVVKTKEDALVDCLGLDATVFLRFTRMCRDIFLILSVLGCAIMIPINLSASDSGPSQILTAFTTMAPKALWSHIACVWIFDIIVAYFLWRNYCAVRNLRRRYFQSSDYQRSLHARTILVTDIPPAYRTDEGLLRLTDEVNPVAAIPTVAIARNVKDLPDLIEQHEKVIRKLEKVLAKYFKHPDRLPPQRPTCRPDKNHREFHSSERVDAIDYYTDRIRELEAEIRHVRESIDKRNAMSYGFASWDSIADAHAVAYAARNQHPHGITIDLAPRPNDLIWSNLALNRRTRKWKRLMIVFWSTVLTVLWIAPNAMIAIFLTDLSNLGLVWPAFQTSLNEHPKIWAAVQGIASPAVTSLIYLVLPIVFRRLAIRGGKLTKTAREHQVLHSLYTFFVFNNLIVFSLFSAVWGFVSAVIDARNHDKNVWDAILAGQIYIKIMTALSQVAPFWVTWLLQRNLGAAIDLIQLINMVWTWFARKFLSPTPRTAIEWTAPPPFDYASYYNYFLFYATIALCFATLQPIVLPVTALYFSVDSWLKKYLLLYVFVTKTESGGRFWRAVYNRMLFALILSNIVTGLVIKARGTWTMVFTLVPLPFLLLAFKLYCRRTFDNELRYYHKAFRTDAEAVVNGKPGKKGTERLASRFGHPALYKPLTTPMVHAKAADALEKLFQGRQHCDTHTGGYSDIALHRMSSNQPGKPLQRPSDAPFEVVAENQLDFSYFKDRPEFRDEFGGGIYGRPEDLITERSHTPRSFMVGSGSPGSSRASSPAPSPYAPRTQHPPMPNISDHPAFHSVETDVSTFYKNSNESESRLLSNPQIPALQPSGDDRPLNRWATDHSYSSYPSARDQSPGPYELYRSR
ncbi:hypothetical protein VTO42DRAFT_5301 [Malbranchea cinnamomea]